MKRFATHSAIVAGILLLAVTLSGCNKLRARDELNKGVRSLRGGNFDEAIEHFQTSTRLDPNLLVAQLYLATAYAQQFVPGATSEKNKEIAAKAIEEFDKVLERDPGNKDALTSKAFIYFNLREWDKARELRYQLHDLDPQNPEHLYSIGVINWTVCYDRRMRLRTQLNIADKPDDPLPARRIPELADQNGELVDEGIQVLEQALEINPKYLDAIAYLNLMYREKADIVPLSEREQYLQTADELFDRHKQVEEQIKREMEQAQPAS